MKDTLQSALAIAFLALIGVGYLVVAATNALNEGEGQ